MLNLSLLVCTKNSATSIMSCLNSSLLTLKAGAELILVDGRSSDNTINLVLEFLEIHNINYYKVITQLNYGLYEAFNLAIENSTRKKILFLHSDDILKNLHTLITDVNYIPNLSYINVSSMFIPPHAGILVCRNIYCNIGKFSTDYKISGDFEWVLRLLRTSNVSFNFSNKTTYVMKSGGVSNSGFISELTKFLEDVRVLKSLGFSFPVYKVLRKKINKLYQLRKI